MADNGTGKPDVDDISLDDARPAKKKSGGAGAAIILILLIVIVAVVWFMGYNAKLKREQEAKQKAEQQRSAMMTVVNGHVTAAIEAAQAGNLDAAIAKLNAAEGQLGLIISSANSMNEQQAALDALNKQKSVMDARKGLEEVRASIADRLGPLGAAFGVAVPAAAAPGTEVVPAPGTEVPATGTAVPAPVDPEAVPAAPVVPAQPAAPIAPAPAAVPAPAAS